mmetsp:Transcript_25204/g.57981  ORF Transcript_25204/g.57981 Transcript_25204/m.57981 type:complete len:205 (-) Transcript_25204:1653-2267(-)
MPTKSAASTNETSLVRLIGVQVLAHQQVELFAVVKFNAKGSEVGPMWGISHAAAKLLQGQQAICINVHGIEEARQHVLHESVRFKSGKNVSFHITLGCPDSAVNKYARQYVQHSKQLQGNVEQEGSIVEIANLLQWLTYCHPILATSGCQEQGVHACADVAVPLQDLGSFRGLWLCLDVAHYSAHKYHRKYVVEDNEEYYRPQQ